MNSTTYSSEAANLNVREFKAISQHLKCNLSSIIDVQQWRYVLWVKFKKDGKIYCRFVSYRVLWKFVPRKSGKYTIGDRVVKVQFADKWSFRVVEFEDNKVLGWFELLPNGAIKRGFDANGDRLKSEQMKALEFCV